jgi:energy-coupling factor transporter ATP-binding protein EcfA2
MAASTSVEIDGFRCFKKLRVDGLARVNLIVGANNSGKTVLLETIEAVVSHDSASVLHRSSIQRGEFRRYRPMRREVEDAMFELDVRHWFHGHVLGPGVGFTVRATGDQELSISRAIEAASAASTISHPNPFVALVNRGEFRLTRGSPDSVVSALTEDGWLRIGYPSLNLGTAGLRLHPPVGFVTTDSLSSFELAPLWTNVVLTPGELQTVEALRLIEPSIDRIAIVESEGPMAKVLLRGAAAPMPLGTLGEGVSRIFALALHLVLARGGFLLIDEIENGLHWSVMPKVWRFLVETALALDIQVFATTHSKDWLEGIAALHRDNPELASQVSVHRLEAGRETSVRFDASRIAEYVEMELEAR